MLQFGGMAMARHRTNAEWQAVRDDREIFGTSFNGLAKKHGINVATIFKRARDEGWSDGSDNNALANKLAREKTNGICFVQTESEITKTLAERIAQAVDKKASVIFQQQLDWELHRLSYDIKKQDREHLQCAKLAGETLKIRHEGERKAWSITDDDGSKPEAAKPLSDFYS